MPRPLYPRIHALVEKIPRGQVATYGQLALIAGCTARTVGFALAALPPGTDIPWHRVINSRGKVSPRAGGDRDQLQQELLIAEGIVFDRDDRIDLEQYGCRLAAVDTA